MIKILDRILGIIFIIIYTVLLAVFIIAWDLFKGIYRIASRWTHE